MQQLEIIDVLVGMAALDGRGEAATRLARQCGAEELLLFVKDVELGSLMPAPGFPQTVRGGPSWRQFLQRCTSPGRHSERVECPVDSWREASCTAFENGAAIFLGGQPKPEAWALVERLMPAIMATLAAEQQARLAWAATADARASAARAHELAQALEAARAQHAQLNAMLREEHRRKDDFLAMLAHELRNPLTPLVTSIELIRRADGQATARQLEIMSRQLRHLSRMVEDLLDVSRVSRGRIQLRRHCLRLADVLAEALEVSRPFLESRRHHVELEIETPDLHVDADSVRLAQVFANLLHNAGKYTDPGGRIRISARREGSDAVVRVEDNGHGMDPSMLEPVFELFTQAPMSLERAQGGLGIGLTLVRALVELHGGKVQAHSEGLGRGSTFTVRLPTVAAEATRPSPKALPAGAGADRALRVLVVDDNEDAANTMADILRLMGHHSAVAFSALQAMHIAEDVEPDLVLLDIGLPEVDGYEVARRLRRGVRRAVRLVAITGYGADSDRRRSREAGFDEHVVKPVMPETLEGIIRRAGTAGCPAVGVE